MVGSLDSIVKKRIIVNGIITLVFGLATIFLTVVFVVLMSEGEGDVFLFVFFPILIFICGLVAVLCARNCSARSIYKYLPGGKEEFDEVSSDIAYPKLHLGSIIIGEKYMICSNVFALGRNVIAELNDIVMVYKQVTRTRYYGVVTVGKTNALVVYKDAVKQPLDLTMRDANVMEILKYFYDNFPTVFVGFNQTLVNKWRQNPSKEILEGYRREQ
jgi:hypothetical protein